MEQGERYKRAFEDAAIGIALLSVSPPGRYIEVNPTFCRMTGYSREELLARDFQSITASQDIDKNLEGLQTLLDGRIGSLHLEKRYIRKDGSAFWARLHVSAVREKQNQPTMLIVQIEDIDERKRMEEALRKEERRLMQVVEQIPAVLWTTDTNLRFTLSVGAGLAGLGLRPNQVVGMTLYEYFRTDDPDTLPIHSCRQALRGESVTYQTTWKDRVFQSYVEPMRDSSGTVIGVIGFALDVTDRMRVEEALRDSGRLNEQIIRGAFEGIIVLDYDLRHQAWNPFMEELTGLPASRVLGKTPTELIPIHREYGKHLLTEENIKEVLSGLQRALAGETVIRPDLAVKLKGTDRVGWFAVRYDPLRNAPGEITGVLVNVRNITGHKEADEALRQNENRLREAVQVSQTGIFDHDQITDTIYWSPEQRKIYGFGPDDPVTIQVFLKCVHPEDRERIAEAVRMAHDSAGDGRFDVEHRILRLDGAVRWLTTRSQTFFREEGGVRRPIRTIGAVLDITERKKAEEAVHTSESRNRALLDALPDVMFRIRRDGLFLDANPSKASGPFALPRDFVGRKMRDMMPPDICRLKEKFMMQAFETGETQVFEYQLPDGENRRDYETRFVVSGPDEVTAILRDVTERRKSEEALRESSQFNQQIISNAREGIIVYDRDCRYLVWNAYMEEFTGLKAEKVLGKRPRNLPAIYQEEHGKLLMEQPTVEGIESSVARAIAGETFAYLEVPFIIKQTGQMGWTSVRYGPFRNAQGEIIGVIATVREITEQKRLEEQLRHAQKLEAVGQLAGGVAHEFNNILTAVIGNLDLGIGQAGEGSELHGSLTVALEAAERAVLLTRQLLTFSRRTPVDRRPLNLDDVARDASRLLRQAIDRRIRVIVQPTEGAWTALADMDQMHQVIMNLCVNARDSLNERMSAKNGRPLPDGWEPRIVIAVENVNVDEAHCRLHYDARPGEYVCVSVTDNGSGIDEAIRDRIFEPFFTTKEIGHGTGLGLATVYGILKQHGGWIELASDKTVGSSFRCYLPRLEEAAESPSPETADTSIPRGHETVLFVDDESSIRQLAQSILENSGYTVLPAENGEQALDIFQRELRRIGLVILDLTMPALSGRDVLRRILAIDPKMRILISSGHQIPNDGNQLRSLGRIEFVPKPYRPDELARSVRSILDRVYTDG